MELKSQKMKLWLSDKVFRSDKGHVVLIKGTAYQDLKQHEVYMLWHWQTQALLDIKSRTDLNIIPTLIKR